MKRRSCIFILIMVFALSFFMVACDKDDNKNNSSSSKDSHSSSSQLESSTSIFDTATTIYVGDKVTANISQAGQQVCFKFVPTETKTYNFKSLGDFDTCCYLYDKNQKLIKSNDNGTNYNFSLDCNLTKGQTYYFVVELFDKNQTENFKVELNIASQQDSSNETNSGSNNDQPSNSQPGSTDGEYVYFGSYPQTRITNSSLISTLNNLAGSLPTPSSSSAWTAYSNYYIADSLSTFMWFIDIGYSNEKYRGVYFSQYRPFWVADESNEDRSYQDDNGYLKNRVYWFKYEPLAWHVLSTEGNKKLLFCKQIIDCTQFDYGTTITNHFDQSDIRTWLNETFYNTAFSSLEKTQIVKTTISNNARNSNPYENATLWNNGVNIHATGDTQDNVFLLSMYEVTNTTYGFSGYNATDTMRKKTVTDYGKCQGAVIDNNGYGYWWTRSPRSLIDRHALVVYNNGMAHEGCSVYNTAFGVVPAITVII